MSTLHRTALASALILALGACTSTGRLFRGYAEADARGMELLEAGPYASDPAAEGQVRFVFDDFGSLTTDVLETYGIPWKLAAAALVRDRRRRDGAPVAPETLDRALAEYGFIRPRRIANWRGPQPRLDRPLGIVSGTAHRGFPRVEVEIANVGCSSCHAAPLYGPDGMPTGEAWLGIPNASLDISAYADGLADALRRELASPDSLLSTMALLFPEMSEGEASTVRKHLVPRARDVLEEAARVQGGLLPFENGGPGLMNGVASLRFLLGVIHRDARAEQVAWTSPPGLEGTTLRRTLLVDGVYGPPERVRGGSLARDQVTAAHLEELADIASLFITGTQGVSLETARAAVPRMQPVMAFLHEVRSPPFPGPVDSTLARVGERVFGSRCAGCHGTYTPGLRDVRLVEHPNRRVAQEPMGTDPVRWQTADSASLSILRGTTFGDHIEVAVGEGYVAPDLAGVWATAPYLHNGSVPTLWHLLHPERRPERFQVGGHALDYDRMGIAGSLDDDGLYAYPADYRPWSRPFVYDTRESGRSNAGHVIPGLTEDQKRALLEYLKVL